MVSHQQVWIAAIGPNSLIKFVYILMYISYGIVVVFDDIMWIVLYIIYGIVV